MALQLTSSVLKEGQAIPKKYTSDGDDVSPPLEWTGTPERTVSFALINDDPDAPRGTWVHWVIFNISGKERELRENVPTDETLPSGAVQGKNDFGNTGYGGPAPPPGKPHRYYFKLYALDAALALGPGVSKEQVLAAMKGHVLGEASLMGTYKR
jgi:Raf kinase inhibitor-like YbhB/YbcL family protein